MSTPDIQRSPDFLTRYKASPKGTCTNQRPLILSIAKRNTITKLPRLLLNMLILNSLSSLSRTV